MGGKDFSLSEEEEQILCRELPELPSNSRTGPDLAKIRSVARQNAYLKGLAVSGNATRAAVAAGLSGYSQAIILWRKDPEFVELENLAMGMYAARLESEAYRRAVEGVSKPLFYQGAPIYKTRVARDENGEPILREDGRPLMEIERDENGEPVMHKEITYSDALLARLLEAKVPGFARKAEITGAGGEPLMADDQGDIARARKIAFALAMGLQKSQAAADAVEGELVDEGDDLC